MCVRLCYSAQEDICCLIVVCVCGQGFHRRRFVLFCCKHLGSPWSLPQTFCCPTPQQFWIIGTAIWCIRRVLMCFRRLNVFQTNINTIQPIHNYLIVDCSF